MMGRRTLVLWPLLAALVGCPSGESPALVAVAVDAGPSSASGAQETAAGYELSLDRGVVVLCDLHFHEPAAVAQRQAIVPLWGLAAAGLARAHPGHDMSGDVQGELAGVFGVALTGEAAALGEGAFYEGDYATASLLVCQDGVEGDAGLDAGDPAAGHSLYLAGTATGDGGPVPFELVLDHAEAVVGIPFEATVEEEAPPALGLRIDVASILGHLDFTALDSDGDGTVTAADEGVLNPLVFGLESTLSYGYQID